MSRSSVLGGGLLSVVLMVFSIGGCPPMAPTDSGGLGDANTDPTLNVTPGDETADAKDEETLKALSEPVEVLDALYEPTAATAPTLSADELAELTAALETGDVAESLVAEEVAVPDDTSLNSPIATTGRLAALFSPTGPTDDNPSQAGDFEGIWTDRAGTLLGTIAGFYTDSPTDALPPRITSGGTFQGQYFDTSDTFVGVISGRWGIDQQGRGFYQGVWRDDNGELLGVLKGRWITGEGLDGGVFKGRWAAFNLCDEIRSLPDDASSFDSYGGYTATDITLGTTSDIDTESQPVTDELDLTLQGGSLCIDNTLPNGFLRGRHNPATSGLIDDPNIPLDPNGGRLRCLWRNSSGEVVGVLIGRYEPRAGVSAEVKPVIVGDLVGRYFDTQGNFVGFVRGVYGRSYNGLGVFEGQYYDENDVEQGWLWGRWKLGAWRVPGGPVFGVWQQTAQ